MYPKQATDLKSFPLLPANADEANHRHDTAIQHVLTYLGHHLIEKLSNSSSVACVVDADMNMVCDVVV